MIKPILFNTDMVKAIETGRKTVTRRICKDADKRCVPDMSFYDPDKRTYAVHNFADIFQTEKLSIVECTCPICPGDILYVRETWCVNPNFKEYYYAAKRNKGVPAPYDLKWRPSIHMPKEAARIWLKVMDVRVERLQDMKDTYSEGIHFCDCPAGYTWKSDADMHNCYIEPMAAMKALWDSTIKKTELDEYGWDANPWVWVIEFERREKPEVEM